MTGTASGSSSVVAVLNPVLSRSRDKKGYVTNIPQPTMDGAAVIGAYHDLWKVEKSFRMAKTDLRARPISCRRRHDIGYADLRVMPTWGAALLVRPL